MYQEVLDPCQPLPMSVANIIGSADLKRELAQKRGKTFTAETFRRWRKVAKVDSRGLYTMFEFARLVLVAEHLRACKPLNCLELKIEIQKIVNKEKRANGL